MLRRLNTVDPAPDRPSSLLAVLATYFGSLAIPLFYCPGTVHVTHPAPLPAEDASGLPLPDSGASFDASCRDLMTVEMERRAENMIVDDTMQSTSVGVLELRFSNAKMGSIRITSH